MDAFLDRPDIKPIFEKYFIPVKLVIQEHDQNEALENPGADALLKQAGGAFPSSLPYSAFLDSKGSPIANSHQTRRHAGPERRACSRQLKSL